MEISNGKFMMMGKVGFESYSIYCVIGDKPHEREIEQELIVDLIVETDFSRVSQSDDLQDAVDYVTLATLCSEIAKKGCYHLIETYVAEVAQTVLRIPSVHSVSIKVRKPSAFLNSDRSMAVAELYLSKS